MAAPTRQYEVWTGSFHNDPVLFRKVLHVMTPAETMQPQYTFSGDLDEFGQPSHEPAHVAWPFQILYTSETGDLRLHVLRATYYWVHTPGIKRGDVINEMDEATMYKQGSKITFAWGSTATFRWHDPTSTWNGGWDDVTIEIKRPDGFAVTHELRALLVQLVQLRGVRGVDATWGEWFRPRFNQAWFGVMGQKVGLIPRCGLPNDVRVAFVTRDLEIFGSTCMDVSRNVDVIGTRPLVTEMMRLWTLVEPQLKKYRLIVDGHTNMPGQISDTKTEAGKNDLVQKAVVYILTEMAKFVEHYKSPHVK